MAVEERQLLASDRSKTHWQLPTLETGTQQSDRTTTRC